jgi:hypothetical protein
MSNAIHSIANAVGGNNNSQLVPLAYGKKKYIRPLIIENQSDLPQYIIIFKAR